MPLGRWPSNTHLRSLDSEITYIWVSQRKRGSAWFLFIHYFTLFSNIAMVFMLSGNFPFERREYSDQFQSDTWANRLFQAQQI
ncbi:hypothetical protein B0H19DRAFT_1137237 [Mycena capillaripes]|nr:hypothetical protein B0H19DRAFT_1137237 [Mycena capillaripes]